MESDNARPHISKKYQQFISSQTLDHTPWGGNPINSKGGRPPNSADLCPIEYVFNDWKERVYKRSPNIVTELKKIAEQEWAKIKVAEVGKKYLHMVKVFKWVTESNGDQYETL